MQRTIHRHMLVSVQLCAKHEQTGKMDGSENRKWAKIPVISWI
ncbi:hypothetical protein AB1K18_06750 [Peribacillus simplex]